MKLIPYIFYIFLLTNIWGKTIINHPFGNGWNPTYKNGDDWGMVYGIVFLRHYMFYYPTLGILMIGVVNNIFNGNSLCVSLANMIYWGFS
jgi:hypothetical protein